MFATKFGEKLAEGLAGQLAAQKIGPALVFWAGGLLVWHGDWKSIEIWLKGINNTPAYIALAMGGLLLASVSGAASQWLQTPVIRWAEGYWPGPLRWFRFALARYGHECFLLEGDRFAQLEGIPKEKRTARQKADLVRLDVLLTRHPLDKNLFMPTTLGNLLRASEEYPKVRYGLDAIVCWPRLWLLMPQETLKTLSESMEELNAAARLMFWAVLFTIWGFWADWALLSLALVPVAYLKMLSAAETYGYLIRAAFDIHRFKLYEALNWPLPPDPEQEEKCGTELNKYLFRGFTPKKIDIRYAKNEISSDS